MASVYPLICDSLLAFIVCDNKHHKMRFYVLFFVLFLGFFPTAGFAQITVSFYSHEFGSSFPHGFVTVEGQKTDGTRLDANYGFTAKTVSPAILWGAVAGKVEVLKPSYIASSDKQFVLTITEREHDAMIAVVEKWRTAKQPSYSLNKTNCLHFVGQIAAALGMAVDYPKALMRKPRSYLKHLAEKNRAFATLSIVETEKR
jgi:hypothetical protein